jgi:hypothetical protein
MRPDMEIFALAAKLEPRFEVLGDKVPVLLVDDFYAYPDDVRARALQQSFGPAPYLYPGRLAPAPRGNPTLETACDWVLNAVNRDYLPRVPILSRGEKLTHIPNVHTDFAIVDVHPDDLAAPQRAPHIDPVPLFALVYLNHEERGGTMFFEQLAAEPAADAQGYPTPGGHDFRLTARIEPKFNRLVIYPGFVPHSGEIAGDWIRTDERFRNPRLTQRFAFLP